MPSSRARLCQKPFLRVIAVAIALAACGGSVVAPEERRNGDAAPPDTGSPDAVAPVDADASVCIAIDPTTYARACSADADCMTVSVGTFCAGQGVCACPNDALAVGGRARYEAQWREIDALPRPEGADCRSCPFFGAARCVKNACILCGGASEPCPDGG